MTDYLAKIAAKTVCEGHDSIGSMNKCITELDPRFDKLRDYPCPHCGGEGAVYKNCEDCDDTGYTVVEDLGVLLGDVVQELYWPDGDGVELTMLVGVKTKVQVGPEWHDMPWIEGDTSLEAAAKAVWDWTEAQEKETA